MISETLENLPKSTKELYKDSVQLDEISQFKSLLSAQLLGQKIDEFQFERQLALIDFYQESPLLLDPHLEEIIKPIMNRLIEMIFIIYEYKEIPGSSYEMTPDIQKDGIELIKSHEYMFKILYRLIKTRGYKSILKFFSNKVDDLEPCVHFVQKIRYCKEFILHWEMRYIMLLWISLLMMIPFDMDLIDSSEQNEQSLVEQIIDISRNYLVSVGKDYEGASILAMRLVTRY
jgi:hypothetical protein